MAVASTGGKSSISMNSALNLPSLEDLEGGIVNTGAGAHIYATDQGAFRQAVDFASDVQEGGERILDKGLDVLNEVSSNSVTALEKSNESLQVVAGTHLAALGAVTDSQTEAIKTTAETMQNVTNTNTLLMQEMIKENGENFESVVGDVRGAFGESVGAIAHLSETQITDGGNLSIDTFKDLIKWLGVAVLVIAAIAFMVLLWRMAK